MIRPPCYNRAARAAGAWMRSGYRNGKPVLRWVPAFSVDRCAVHDGRGVGPNGEGYAEAHGWDCSGCRWESGHGDDWELPPLTLCETCYHVHAATGDTCLVCGAGLSPLMTDTPRPLPPSITTSTPMVAGLSWLQQQLLQARDEYQAFRDKAAALGIWISRDPWVNPVPEITMRD